MPFFRGDFAPSSKAAGRPWPKPGIQGSRGRAGRANADCDSAHSRIAQHIRKGWVCKRMNHGSHRCHGLGGHRIRGIRAVHGSCSQRRLLRPAGSTEGARFISPWAKPWVTRTRSKSSQSPNGAPQRMRMQQCLGPGAETTAKRTAFCFTPLGCTTMAWRHGNQGFALAW
jgi:hypothetical protein